jgi:hypothetical protein
VVNLPLLLLAAAENVPQINSRKFWGSSMQAIVFQLYEHIIELMGILYWGLGVVLLPLGPQAGPEVVCCSSI